LPGGGGGAGVRFIWLPCREGSVFLLGYDFWHWVNGSGGGRYWVGRNLLMNLVSKESPPAAVEPFLPTLLIDSRLTGNVGGSLPP